VDAFLHIGLSNAVMATILAVFAACSGWIVRRPAFTHCLWLLVLLKLNTPPVHSIPVPWLAVAQAEPSREVLMELSTAEARPVPLDPMEDNPVPAARQQGQVDTSPASESLPPTRGLGWQPIVLALWITGSGVWWAVAGVRVNRFRRLLCYAEPAPPGVQLQARELSARLGLARSPGVWFLTAPVSPMLWTLARSPRLLLPLSLWQRLSPDQQRTLLAHELAHLRRRDHWMRFLELFVLGLYWWLPVVWWARRQLREAEEQCCDAWVVWALPDAAQAYASALLETVTFLSQSRSALPLAASGIGHTSLLRRRLTMIMRGSTPRALSAVGLLSILGMAIVWLPLLPTWARPEAPAAVDAVTEEPAPEQDPKGAEYQDLYQRRLLDAQKVLADRGRELGDQIQMARDEVELLHVQRQIKQAQLLGAKAAVKHAMVRLQRIEQLVKSRAADATSAEEARSDVEAQQAQLGVKEGELHESEVRLQQAARRVSDLERRRKAADLPENQPKPNSAPEPLPKAREGQLKKKLDGDIDFYKKRLEDEPARTYLGEVEKMGRAPLAREQQLEKKLDEIIRQVESLRKQIRQRPGETDEGQPKGKSGETDEGQPKGK